MPLTRIICPHCEKSVEVNMTSVTRSRDCPLCGRTIMLQFTTQEKRQRRKALLTPTANAGGGADDDSGVSSGFTVTPKPIEGDLRERMMRDPEVIQRVRVIKISVVVIVAIIAVVVLGSMFHWWSGIAQYVNDGVKQFNASRQASADDSAVDVKAERKTTAEPSEKMTFPTPPAEPPVKEEAVAQDEPAVLKVAVSFLQAANVDQRLGFVLAQRTAASKMREYYQRHADGPVPYETIESLGSDSADKTVFNFLVVLKDGERRRLAVRKSMKLGYLVDWPSFVIYSDMDWSEFASTRPQNPVLFRVMAGLSDVYKNEFIDPEKFLCLKVVNPLDAHAPPLYAYAQRSSSLGHTLEFIMRRAAGASVPLVLKLKFPEEGGAPDQVWVHEFVSEGWMTRIW